MTSISSIDDTKPYITQLEQMIWDPIPPNYESIHPISSSTQSQLTSETPIIIDNGSYECRAGWSICPEPTLTFRSLVAKLKLTQLNAYQPFIVGNKIFDYEQGKIHKKSPFEKNIITHFGTQEHIFDHIFTQLNITDESVNHPILFTEPLCNLNYTRKNITEMLFELYSVPSLCYSIDMMLSLYHNDHAFRSNDIQHYNALVISSSYQTTHVLPIIKGKADIEKGRRISIGSEHVRDLLMKSLHLKFPELKSRLTNEAIQYIQERYLMTALNYDEQLKVIEHLVKDEQKYLHELELVSIFGSMEMYHKAYKDEIEREIQMKNKYSYLKSYTNVVDYTNKKINETNGSNSIIKHLIAFERPKFLYISIPTEEEIKKTQEQRKEQSQRLKEIMQKKREENIRNLQIELESLEQIAQLKDTDKFQLDEELTNAGYASYDELMKRINKINRKLNIDISTNKDNVNKEEIDIDKRWPLLLIQDEDLTSDQIKMKRIQKMQKKAYLSRLEKREQTQKEKERILQLKQKSPEAYLISLYRNKKEIKDRLEKYKQLRKDMANRHSKSNLKRMQTLAELGKDTSESGNNSNNNYYNNNNSSNSSVDDDFGKKDEDWDIYREVSRHNLSDKEDEDQQQLHEVEMQINEMDPDYYKNYQKYQYEFYHKHNELYLGVDQFRGPELMFKPSLIGIEQAGVVEIINALMKTVDNGCVRSLCGNIFLTGGNVKYKNIKERIYRELRMNTPCDVGIGIRIAEDPVVDAWKGGRDFCNDVNNKNCFVSREEYNECGCEYFKENRTSNCKVNTMGRNMNEIYNSQNVVSKKYKI